MKRVLQGLVCIMIAAASLRAGEHRAVGRVGVSEPVVALTFDDGPHPTCTQALIDLFAKEGVKATFFVKGENVQQYPELAKALVEAGHEVGNHSMTHAHLEKLATLDEVKTELVETQTVVEQATGVPPKVFRAPYLAHSEHVWTVLDELALPSIVSSQGTRDWDKASTVEQITDRATLKTVKGDIVLMHTWSAKTQQAMPEIVRRLKAKGLRCVTVSELLALQRAG